MSIVVEDRETRTTRTSHTSVVEPRLKSRTSVLGGVAWMLLLASVAGLFACRTGASSTKRFVQKPIEQVRLLDRMAGTNPLRSEVETLPEPDPSSSRVVKLRLHDNGDQLVEIEMVQPLSWLESFEAKLGGTIELDLPEVGAVGKAKVVAIEPCPPIPSGQGNLVTALFKHHAKQALNLHVANSAVPIGVTPNHPIWSEDRQAFVPAGQLQPGERVRTRTGESTTIVKVMPRPGPEPVFNLQVHGEHVYRVGPAGLLVHNKAMPFSGSLELPRLVEQLYSHPDAQRALLRAALGTEGTGQIAHHLIPLQAIDECTDILERAARGGFDLNGVGNGMALNEIQHSGGHPTYNQIVIDHLKDLEQQLLGASDQAVAARMQQVADELRSLIDSGTFLPNF